MINGVLTIKRSIKEIIGFEIKAFPKNPRKVIITRIIKIPNPGNLSKGNSPSIKVNREYIMYIVSPNGTVSNNC